MEPAIIIFSIDAYIVAYFKANMLTIALALMFLKGLSDISPWNWDNKVVELLYSMANGVKKINGGSKK